MAVSLLEAHTYDTPSEGRDRLFFHHRGANRLLVDFRASALPSEAIPLSEHGLCRELSPSDVVVFQELLAHQSFGPRELIIRRGDTADRLYLLVRGEVSVSPLLPDARVVRLSTLSPGMTFGELAVVDRALRSADVRADGPVECYVLSIARFDELGKKHPEIKMKLLENLLHNVSQMMTRLNRQMMTLVS